MRRVIAAVVLAACGPVIDPAGAGTTTGTSDGPSTSLDPGTVSASDPSGPSPTTDATTTGTTTTDPTSTTTGSDTVAVTETDGVPFIIPPDGGPPEQCDLWDQDCPPGEKCMPWANDGGSSWNDTRCSPIAEEPRGVGEPCTVVGSAVSGIDDCVLGAMCWYVDDETNMGECVGFCEGSEQNPLCADACDICPLSGDGVLILCLPSCDPIAQDCDQGQACYPWGDAFLCAADASGEAGGIGEPCEFRNVCDAGNFCANAEAVPNCEGNTGCCAPYCDVEGADGCDALLPGTSCVPWFEDGQGPGGCAGTSIIGACLVPS